MMKATRLFDLLDQYSELYKDKEDALVAKEKGKWVKYSSQDYINYSYALSYGLLALGIKPGDKVASVSNNRPEWNFLDMGLSMAGIVHVPIYPTISDNDFEFVLNHSEPKLLFVSHSHLLKKLEPISANVNSIDDIYTFNEIEGAKNWKDIYRLGKERETDFRAVLTKTKDSIKPDDLATLIYTSGTTGNPKGVMLSHKNIISNLSSIDQVFNFNDKQRTLSFLPISHVFERTINYHFQDKGLSIYYAESLATIGDNLREVKPHVFIAVPRVLERVYDRIISKGKDLKGFKRQLFFWAVNLGLQYDFDKSNWFYKIKLKIADKLIFSKWRGAIGGATELIVTGGAAMQPRLIKVFNAAGIPTVEGYGMTETSPVIAANDYYGKKVKIGSVGVPLPGIEVKLLKDGEIMTRSDCVMMGYYKEPEMTREVIEPDGWLHTGDIGIMDDQKFIKITDRKKEIFKLSSGKYIAPQVIENVFKESLFIEQIFVFGENQKFASAIIAPNFQFLKKWAIRQKVDFKGNKDLVNKEVVVKRYHEEVQSINEKLGQTEHIKRFKLVGDEWSTNTGELSPTLKLKRRFLVKKYNSLIEEIFAVDNVGK